MRQARAHMSAGLSVLMALAGCDAPPSAQSTDNAQQQASADARGEAAAVFPDSLVVIGDGYPASGGLCRRLGESAATANWLDASAILVGCPTQEAARMLGGKVVGKVGDITVISIPTPDENASMAETTPAPLVKADPAKDMIRSKGGLEDKCKAAVAGQGTRVIGTNRIEESEAAVEVFVNVEGGSAPWRCVAHRDGTIGAVEFTGDEGAL